jgi:hypothetical protein
LGVLFSIWFRYWLQERSGFLVLYRSVFDLVRELSAEASRPLYDWMLAKSTDANYTQSDDLLFAGNADAQRVPYIGAAIEAGFAVRLHGIYWDRFQETRKIGLGQADIPTLRSTSHCATRDEGA